MNKADKLFLQALKHNLKNGISLEQSLRNYGYINKADKGCQDCIRFETEELYKQIVFLMYYMINELVGCKLWKKQK